jgi:3-isopropylmalate/(R)-2-methylmalate dehydratase small subunit
VTAAAPDVERVQAVVAAEPSLPLTVDLAAQQLRCGTLEVPLSLPAGARESFLDGTWDATGLLLDRYEEVEQTARRLPYLSGWTL